VIYAIEQTETTFVTSALLAEMKNDIESFIAGYLMGGTGHAEPDQNPEFWGYFADYDWYLFTRLWGFMRMPAYFPKLCFDLKQYAYHLGVARDRFPKELQPEHNALVDARWNKKLYDFLSGIDLEQRRKSSGV